MCMCAHHAPRLSAHRLCECSGPNGISAGEVEVPPRAATCGMLTHEREEETQNQPR